jgi:pantoate--beta-alanine ligase
MSSRNQYLDADERRVAPLLYATLGACRQRLQAGERRFSVLEGRALRSLRRAGFRPDYVAIRDAADLSRPTSGSVRLRVLAAARLGRARLIDNVAVRLR